MTTLTLAVGTAILLGIAARAQYRISLQMARPANALITRAVLLLVGAAFGYYCARFALTRIDSYLAFLSGLGLVHVPAAAILFLKRVRREEKS